MVQAVNLNPDGAVESSASAVSWGPIIAGATTAAAISLCLVILGSGLGLTMVSPWAGDSASASTIAISAVIWFVVIQWVSSGLGGYVTGRLRTKWVGVHTDEVFFRDTAHGFVAWTVATLFVAWLMSGTMAGLIGKGADVASTVAGGAAMGAAANADKIASMPSALYVDRLLRPANGAAATPPAGNDAAAMSAARDEIGRILMTGATGDISTDDKTYLAQLISTRTGMPQADAEKRVNDVIGQIDAAKTQAQKAADDARKAGIKLSLLMFMSLLIGAFIASVAAAYGGRLRDDFEESLIVAR